MPERKCYNTNLPIYGFPLQRGPWCNTYLKVGPLDAIEKLRVPDDTRKLVYGTQNRPLNKPRAQGANTNIVKYMGIAADEPIRIARHTKPNIVLPLVEIGWDEATAKQWCIDNDLLSPIYTDSARGGCWFCHNQGIGQLRLLRKNYPELWAMLMAWDLDSPVSFRADGHTVHDFDRRFQLEDECLIDPKAHFKWAMLDDDLNYSLFADDWR